ncbi:hypothetical protein ACP4OV_013466 [Aristida adscensionis]
MSPSLYMAVRTPAGGTPLHCQCARRRCVRAAMAPRPSLSLLVLLFLLFPAAGDAAATAAPAGPGNAAFNVTEILAAYPEFRLFNFLLTKTGVAREVNTRKTVTVLVPHNAAVDWLLRRSAKLPRAALVELMSVHIALDYFDAAKLAALPPRQPTVVTTLFQTTGTAKNRTGFLNVTSGTRGGVVFISAAPGALVSATFKRAVTAKPYNISVLEISNFVVPPGVITRARQSTPAPPAPRMRQMSTAPSPAPAALPPRMLPTLVPAPPEEESVEGPGDETIAPAPSHGHATQATRWWAGAAMAVAIVLRFL